MHALNLFRFVERDGECFIDEECIGSDVCEVRDACPGLVALRAAEENCDDQLPCEVGLSCVEGVCLPPSEEQERWRLQCPLRLGLYCDGGQNNEPGRCRVVNDQLVPNGAQCDPQQGPYCEAGLSCALDRVDLGGPRFACFETVGAGEECRGGIPSQCAAGHFCRGIDFSNPFNLELRGNVFRCPAKGALRRCPIFEVCGPDSSVTAGNVWRVRTSAVPAVAKCPATAACALKGHALAGRLPCD